MGRILNDKNPNRMMFVDSESRLYKLKGIVPLPEVEGKDVNLRRIGNDGRILLRYLLPPAYRLLTAIDFAKGLVMYDDEIRKPTATEPEAVTFVEDDKEVVEMPPIENYKPRRKSAKKKRGGNENEKQ